LNVSEDDARQAIVDHEHLRLLSIAYLVSACLNALYSLLGLLYAFMGVFMSALIARAPVKPGQGPPPELMVWFFGLFGFAMFSIMVGVGALKFIAYRRLKQRRSRVFCMVVAGISCVGVPYGTLLGVFTFMVLGRPSVTKLFEVTPPPISAPDAVAGGG
jgi:hypothetical protein